MGQEGESGEEMMMGEWSERCSTVRWKSRTGQQGCRQAMCVCSVIQSCRTLCDPKDRSPSDSSVHEFSRQEHWSGFSFLEAVKGKNRFSPGASGEECGPADP